MLSRALLTLSTSSVPIDCQQVLLRGRRVVRPDYSHPKENNPFTPRSSWLQRILQREACSQRWEALLCTGLPSARVPPSSGRSMKGTVMLWDLEVLAHGHWAPPVMVMEPGRLGGHGSLEDTLGLRVWGLA